MSQDLSTAAQDAIFALDIGTRSVVGLIVEPDGDNFRVIDCEIQEHAERSMLDGQIHDIGAVAKVIETVKNRLAAIHGPLQQVAVAAAGRSLRTRRVSVETDSNHNTPFSKDDVLTLEFTAVQEAQAALAQELNDLDSTRYYCVGYSVVNYYLDGEVIGSLVDQRGHKVGVDVIATFLPRVVVDSLLVALQLCDLEMQALTLEPIAAIHVLIPSTMRRLNIALVDIGAGTSDVALTEEGAITAYGMVPVAGDEITDALMNAYLLDFPVAEEVKRKLSTNEIIQFQDILGMEHSYTCDEIVATIDKEINQLAQKIAEKILELNGKAPQAVMLIGGGSLTPRLPEKVAGMLEMPSARVAVRGADAIKQFTGNHPAIQGPEFVTPVGIAVAARRHPIRYVTVTVNDKIVRIFDLRKMTIGDAILASGLDIRRLHGRPGLAMSITLNGRLKIIPGGHGTPPVITKNGESAALDTPLSDGDVIVAIPGENGQQATGSIKDLVTVYDTLDITCNGQILSLGPIALIDGTVHPLDTPLTDRMNVEIRLPETIYEALEAAGGGFHQEHAPAADVFCYTLNGQARSHPRRAVEVAVNGKPASLHDFLRTGDCLAYEVKELPPPAIADVLTPAEWVVHAVKVTFNGQPVTIESGQLEIYMNGQKVAEDQLIDEGADISVKAPSAPEPPVFNDVFRYVEVSLDKPEGLRIARLATLVNGEPANFQTPLKTGDQLEMYWEEIGD